MLPVGIKSLLGLGLKFCIERPRPYQDLCSSLIKFKRDLEIHQFLIDEEIIDPSETTNAKSNNSFNRRLYLPNDEWIPPPLREPYLSAFEKFETAINHKRRNLPTYRRWNLRPIQRRALKQIQANKSIIIHGSDKGLGPYCVLKSTYIKQSLKEHMLNPNNYVRLSPDEAVKELKEQKLAFEDAYVL